MCRVFKLRPCFFFLLVRWRATALLTEDPLTRSLPYWAIDAFAYFYLPTYRFCRWASVVDPGSTSPSIRIRIQRVKHCLIIPGTFSAILNLLDPHPLCGSGSRRSPIMQTREDPNPHHCKKGSFDPNRYRTDGWISDFARNRIQGIGTRYGYSVDYPVSPYTGYRIVFIYFYI